MPLKEEILKNAGIETLDESFSSFKYKIGKDITSKINSKMESMASDKIQKVNTAAKYLMDIKKNIASAPSWLSAAYKKYAPDVEYGKLFEFSNKEIVAKKIQNLKFKPSDSNIDFDNDKKVMSQILNSYEILKKMCDKNGVNYSSPKSQEAK